MIGADGTTYEAVVTDSTGNEAFEKAALTVVKQWTFEPALMDGVPIDAGSNFKLKFSLTGPGVGARTSFIRSIKRFNKAASNDDQKGAEAKLGELEAENLYEDAYLNFAKYSYYQKWGNESQQLKALRRAVAHESDAHYLPKKHFVAALLTMFALEVKLREYAHALTTWKKLEVQELDEHKMASLQKVVEKIAELKGDDRSYVVSGQIGSNSSWFHLLLKNSFNIDITSGVVAEIKLRCDKKYVFFRYEPDTRYQISGSAGSCSIELVGDPGTMFSLVQS